MRKAMMKRRHFLTTAGLTLPASTLLSNSSQAAPGSVNPAGETLDARRMEILRWFEENEYGLPPQGMSSSISWAASPAPDAGMVAEIGTLVVSASDGRKAEIPVKLFRSAEAKGKLPATLFICNRGHEEMEYRADAEFWPVADILATGWMAVAFNVKDVSHDEPEEWAKNPGIVVFDSTPAGPSRGKALSAWAWVASEIRAHLCQREDVEKGRIAVIGHSRGGKAALLAGARDSGFAVSYSSSSGCGGAGHNATREGEKIADITSRFPNWFCDRFAEFSGKDGTVEYDQHHLLGCIAPQRVYVSSSADDAWADPKSEYFSCQLATPIHQFRGVQGLAEENLPFPKENEKRHGGSIGYHLHEGEHNLRRADWKWFLEFVG